MDVLQNHRNGSFIYVSPTLLVSLPVQFFTSFLSFLLQHPTRPRSHCLQTSVKSYFRYFSELEKSTCLPCSCSNCILKVPLSPIPAVVFRPPALPRRHAADQPFRSSPRGPAPSRSRLPPPPPPPCSSRWGHQWHLGHTMTVSWFLVSLQTSCHQHHHGE